MNTISRTITNPWHVKLKPFEKHGLAIPQISWHDISLDKETGFGAFILSMLPGAKSASHKRLGFEEIYILEGGLIDADGTVLQKGEFITFEPGSIDSTYTSKGCLLLVIVRESSPTH